MLLHLGRIVSILVISHTRAVWSAEHVARLLKKKKKKKKEEEGRRRRKKKKEEEEEVVNVKEGMSDIN